MSMEYYQEQEAKREEKEAKRLEAQKKAQIVNPE